MIEITFDNDGNIILPKDVSKNDFYESCLMQIYNELMFLSDDDEDDYNDEYVNTLIAMIINVAGITEEDVEEVENHTEGNIFRLSIDTHDLTYNFDLEIKFSLTKTLKSS